MTRQQNVSTTSFDVRLQEEEGANQIHADETVSWIAIEAASAVNGSYAFESGLTGSAVTHNDYTLNYTQTFSSSPVFLAGLQTYAGADPAWVRGRTFNPNSVTFFLEEEQSVDTETDHNAAENVGFWAMTAGLIE